MDKPPETRLHISPSILSADCGALREESIRAVNAGGDSIHIDVMDGHYVHNLSFGPSLIRALRPHLAVPIVVHLELAVPDQWIGDTAEAGADMIVVQEDTAPNLPFTIAAIREAGIAAGAAVNPDRNFRRIEAHPHLLGELDLLIVMGVYPGFGAQRPAATTPANIRRAVELRDSASANFAVGVDGGVNPLTVPGTAAAGADYFIAGSAIFGGDTEGDIARNILELRKAAGAARP